MYVVKMTFCEGGLARGPIRALQLQPRCNTRRAIDFHEGEKIDEEALKALIRAAVTLNAADPRPSISARHRGGAWGTALRGTLNR